jgi:hypothetical protein
VTAADIRSLLGLVPLPVEGGLYVESWRSDERLAAAALPPRYGAPRALGTAIYYLLEAGACSTLHRLRSDEVFHFYLGDPVEVLLLREGEGGRQATLGPDLAAGMRPQLVVPRGTWQGLALRPGGRWALLGTTVAPGFDLADFERGSRSRLTAAFPALAARIAALTPAD